MNLKLFAKKSSLFNLFEICVVALILGAFVAIMLPTVYYVRSSTRISAVVAQATKIGKSAKEFMADKGLRRVSYKTLIKENACETPDIFLGEKYDDIIFDSRGGTFVLKTSKGNEIPVKY